MDARTNETHIYIDADGPSIYIRTARSLEDLVRELIFNNGNEFALWAEATAKEAADKWRATVAREERARYSLTVWHTDGTGAQKVASTRIFCTIEHRMAWVRSTMENREFGQTEYTPFMNADWAKGTVCTLCGKPLEASL